MALLLGDLPRVEQVELDSAGDVGDAGLAGLAAGKSPAFLVFAGWPGRGDARKTSPNVTTPDTVELITRLRKELAGPGLDAGPQTIAWHPQHDHQLKVSAATVSRHLARPGLVTPDPSRRPKSSYIRFAAEQPNECWQADFTHYPLAGGAGTEILTWLDDHARHPLSLTAHHRVTGPTVLLASYRPSLDRALARALGDDTVQLAFWVPGQ